MYQNYQSPRNSLKSSVKLSSQSYSKESEFSLSESLNSKSSLLLSSYQIELEKKVMKNKSKQSKKDIKSKIDTKYTKALKQYMKQQKNKNSKHDKENNPQNKGVNYASKTQGFKIPTY